MTTRVNALGLTNVANGGIITTMDTQTIKIWKGTLKKLRMIYALSGKSMVFIVDTLVTRELERMREQKIDEDS